MKMNNGKFHQLPVSSSQVRSPKAAAHKENPPTSENEIVENSFHLAVNLILKEAKK